MRNYTKAFKKIILSTPICMHINARMTQPSIKLIPHYWTCIRREEPQVPSSCVIKSSHPTVHKFTERSRMFRPAVLYNHPTLLDMYSQRRAASSVQLCYKIIPPYWTCIHREEPQVPSSCVIKSSHPTVHVFTERSRKLNPAVFQYWLYSKIHFE